MITVSIIGQLTKDPKIEKKDYWISRFSVVTTDSKKKKDGEMFEKKTFFVCNCFGSLAESTQGLKEGTTVAVTGRLRIEQGEYNGEVQSSNFVDVRDIEVINTAIHVVKPKETTSPDPEAKKFLLGETDDIPF